MSNGNLMVFTGTANPVLAQEVAKHLGIELGVRTLAHLAMAKPLLNCSKTCVVKMYSCCNLPATQPMTA